MLQSQLIQYAQAFWERQYSHVYLDMKEHQAQMKIVMVCIKNKRILKRITNKRNIKEKDNCKINKCPSIANCTSSLNSYTCKCPTGYLYENVSLKILKICISRFLI